MSLEIGAALEDGLDRMLSRTGAILTVAYLSVYFVYQTGYNGLMNALYARLDVPTTAAQPALDVSTTVNGLIVVASLIAMLYLTIVAVRTFVAGEQHSIPGKFLTDGVPFAMANLFVGGLVYGLIVAVGTLFIVVPGVILYVSFVFMLMYVAAENENFVTALKKSWELTSGERWSVFGLLFVVFAIALVLGLVVGFVGAFATFALGPAAFAVMIVLLIAPLTMFQLAVLASAFNQLRADGGEGSGTTATTPDAPSTPA